MATEKVKLNKNSMIFVDEGCNASVKLTEGSNAPVFEMVAYSGGVIKNHWYWGDLAIDLSGMAFPKKKMPILEDHYTEKKIGFSTKMTIDDSVVPHALTVKNDHMNFVDTPESLAFRANSSAGFPYEASIYAKPTSIEEIGEGDTTEVNGYTFKGPGTIWRKSIFKEASVCTFGYDPNTKSVAMSEGEEEFELEYVNEKFKLNQQEEKKPMKKEQFKMEHPEEYAALVKEISDSITTKFTAEKQELEAKLAEVTSENTKLSEENKGIEKRIMTLEKASMLSAERELKNSADGIFATQFKEAELPERLFSKVRKLVNHEEFVKEGELDTESFKAAVDAELKDWIPEEGQETVHGFSTTTKTHGEDTSKKLKETDDTVNRMLKHLGQEVK